MSVWSVFAVIALKFSFLSFAVIFFFLKGVYVCVCACQQESKYLCRSSGEGQGQSMTDSPLGNKDTHVKADSQRHDSTSDGERVRKTDAEDTDRNRQTMKEETKKDRNEGNK